MEVVLLGLLALHGIACTAALVACIGRVAPWPAPPDDAALARHPPEAIFPIMAEFFPAEFRRYREGRLESVERGRAWEASCAIFDARTEIDEICG